MTTSSLVKVIPKFTYFRGRVALHAILKALGVGSGHLVATQAFTCSAVPEGIMATGAIRTQTTTRKCRVEFLAFMGQLLADLPMITGREIHVILDTYGIHKRNAEWLAAHPTVTFHFTPTSASWLNQVEIWFGILSRKAMQDGSFRNVEQLMEAIEAFIAAFRPTAKPFVKRKREVKGAQPKNTILNLCNYALECRWIRRIRERLRVEWEGSGIVRKAAARTKVLTVNEMVWMKT